MFGLGPATRVYLAAGATDMRKGFEGLYGLARDRLRCEPLSGHLFVFANAQRNRLKVLYWGQVFNEQAGYAVAFWPVAESVRADGLPWI